jgi:hypothetical protein
MITTLALLVSVALAQEPTKTTVVCYDGKEKLMEMEVKSVKIVNSKTTEVETESGSLTITNLRCKVK